MKLKKILLSFKKIFTHHKLKLFSLFFFFVIFFLLLFPYSDLSGFITSKVSQFTKNKVLFQFDDLRVLFFPSPGIKLKNVNLSTTKISNLKISTLKARLSLLSLLVFKLNYQVDALGFFGGDLKVILKSGKNIVDRERKKKIKTKFVKVQFKNLDLTQLKTLLSLPIEGQTQIQIQSTLDTQFSKQPEGQGSIDMKNFKLSNYSMNTPFGPMNLPEIYFSLVSIHANINEGVFILEKAQFGTKENPLNGDLKGNFEINFSSTRGRIRPLLKSYQIKVTLSLVPSLQREFSLFLDPLKKYKVKSSPQGRMNYSFQVRGKGTKSFPKLSSY